MLLTLFVGFPPSPPKQSMHNSLLHQDSLAFLQPFQPRPSSSSMKRHVWCFAFLGVLAEIHPDEGKIDFLQMDLTLQLPAETVQGDFFLWHADAHVDPFYRSEPALNFWVRRFAWEPPKHQFVQGVCFSFHFRL